jgi:hypothetical protein
MPAVRRLASKSAAGREASDGARYSRLINGDRGGSLSYSLWRRCLELARGYTAAHPDGIVNYTADELRHVCASLLIASGASDMQVAHLRPPRPGPRIHPGRHEPGRQPTLRIRNSRRRRLGRCLIRALALQTVGPAGEWF